MLSILIVNLELHKLYASVPAVYPGAHDRFSTAVDNGSTDRCSPGTAVIHMFGSLSIGYSVVTSDVVGTVRQIALSSGARTSQRPMSDNAILAAMRRLGIGKEEMTGHGFRAVARTIRRRGTGRSP